MISIGGRGATSGIVRGYVPYEPLPTNIYSSDMTPQEYKAAVQSEANFLFRELEQDKAIQIIIYRSFTSGIPTVTLNESLITSGLTKSQAYNIMHSVEEWIDRFDKRQKLESKRAAGSAIESAKKAHLARKEALSSINSQLKLAKRRIKRNYGI